MNLQYEYQQALELLNKEDFVSSEIYLKNVLSKNPQHAGALMSYFRCLYQQKRFQEALPLVARLYSSHSENAEFTWDYVDCLYLNGCYQDVINIARQYLANHFIEEKYIQVLAQSFYKNNECINALAYAHWSYALNNTNQDNLKLLVEIYQKYNEPDKVRIYLQQYLEINPDDHQLQLVLGDVYNQLHLPIEAFKEFKKVLQLYPNNVDMLTLVGKQATDIGEFMYAEQVLTKAIKLNPQFDKAFFHYGFLKFEEGDYVKAIELYQKVVQLNPEFAVAYYNLSLCYFSLGQFAIGFDLYQWRWKMPQNLQHIIQLPLTKWNFDFKNTSHLLVWAEQGVGDIVFFGRALNYLMQCKNENNMAMHVTFACDKRLIALFQLNFPDIQMIPYSKKNIAALLQSNESPDSQISIGDLLAWEWKKLDLDNIETAAQKFEETQILNTPVLRKPISQSQLLSDRQNLEILSQTNFKPKLKVGISWHSIGERYGEARSLQLQDFIPLFKGIKDIVWVSLQYGDHQKEIDQIKKKIPKTSYLYQDSMIDHQQDLFSLCAMMRTLDLIVSIDNSTIHLAGALDIPSIVLLKEPYNWRWPLKGDNSFWYPSVNVLRWKKKKDIKTLMSEIGHVIQNLMTQ